MEKNSHYYFIFCFLFLSFSVAQAQGIKFFKGSFTEAKEKALQENKLIFVDCYTVWCGPCRRMAATTFKDQRVGDFYNPNFINLKIDMEKGEGKTLAKTYGVRSYPTLIYLNGDGEVVHRTTGGRPAEPFIQLGQAALSKFDDTEKWSKSYSEGKRDAKTVLGYIKSLNRTGESSLAISNAYLTDQIDLDKEENLEILFEGFTQADSRLYDLYLSKKSGLIKLKGREAFENRIESACWATFSKGKKYQNLQLISEAQDKMDVLPKRQKVFIYKSNMQYATEQNDPVSYVKNAKKYASTGRMKKKCGRPQ